jgi:hypothetical protein
MKPRSVYNSTLNLHDSCNKLDKDSKCNRNETNVNAKPKQTSLNNGKKEFTSCFLPHFTFGDL